MTHTACGQANTSHEFVQSSNKETKRNTDVSNSVQIRCYFYFILLFYFFACCTCFSVGPWCETNPNENSLGNCNKRKAFFSPDWFTVCTSKFFFTPKTNDQQHRRTVIPMNHFEWRTPCCGKNSQEARTDKRNFSPHARQKHTIRSRN